MNKRENRRALNFIKYCSSSSRKIFDIIFSRILKAFMVFIFPGLAIYFSIYNTMSVDVMIGTFLFSMMHVAFVLKYKYMPASVMKPISRDYIVKFNDTYIFREEFNQNYYIFSVIILVLMTAANIIYTMVLSLNNIDYLLSVESSQSLNLIIFIFLSIYSIYGVIESVKTFTSMETEAIESWHKWKDNTKSES